MNITKLVAAPIAAAAGALLVGVGIAHANPSLTADELEFAKSTAHHTCNYFAAHPTQAGFTTIVAGIVGSGYTSTRAGYIMAYQMSTTCPDEVQAATRAANGINSDD